MLPAHECFDAGDLPRREAHFRLIDVHQLAGSDGLRQTRGIISFRRVDGGTRASLEHDRPAGLCLTVSTEAVPVAALRALNEQELRVVTQVEAASLEEAFMELTRDAVEYHGASTVNPDRKAA